MVLLFLRNVGLLRISDEIEKKGIDLTIAGGPAFYYEKVDSIEHHHEAHHSLHTEGAHHDLIPDSHIRESHIRINHSVD